MSPAPCTGTCGADGVQFLYLGVAVPRSGFTNGYVPLPATGAGFGSKWANAFPTNQYSNYAYGLDHGYWGLFLQDQWRITPKLTFNYGLRWDLETGLSNEIDTDYNGWQPRIGLAWSPDSKTVIRAGYGLVYGQGWAGNTFGEVLTNSYPLQVEENAIPLSTAYGAAFLPLPPFLATSAVSFLSVRAIHVAVPSAARHLRPTGGQSQPVNSIPAEPWLKQRVQGPSYEERNTTRWRPAANGGAQRPPAYRLDPMS